MDLARAHLEAGRAAWPGIEVTDEAFARHLAEASSSAGGIEGLAGADLYLACACAAGDEAAVRRCDAEFSGEIRRALARVGLAESEIDAVQQALRAKLFVAEPPEPRYIARYNGKGRLGGWMRVIAVHMALKRFRRSKREQPVEEAAELGDEGKLAALSPELLHLKQTYAAELKQAFAVAVRTLEPRQRELLRGHHIEGLSVDQLGERYEVHRATAARWLQKAREALAQAVRREVMQRCQIAPETYQSVVALVRSQLDLSVCRVLGSDSETTEPPT